jgi:hypothetical protein
MPRLDKDFTAELSNPASIILAMAGMVEAFGHLAPQRARPNVELGFDLRTPTGAQ